MEGIECLADYQIGEKLGLGSFGTVYKALHTLENKTYAIKVIQRRDIDRSPQRLRLMNDLHREIKILTDVSKSYTNGHPNIVRLYHNFKAKKTGDIYLVMEFCSGDLADFLRQHGPLPVDVARRFVKQLANALQFLRSPDVNIIHRDLKPQNLLVTSMDLQTAEIKVADFGLARELSSEDLAGTQCGTPLYMSPEQIGGEKYGENVDLWSVGAILYEMVTGRKVFNVKTRQELFDAAQTNPRIMLSSGIEKNIHCRSLLEGLLEKEPSERMTYEDFFNHPFLLPDPPNNGCSSSIITTTSSSKGGETKSSSTLQNMSAAPPTITKEMSFLEQIEEVSVRSESPSATAALRSEGAEESTTYTGETKAVEEMEKTAIKSGEASEALEDSWELLTVGDFHPIEKEPLDLTAAGTTTIAAGESSTSSDGTKSSVLTKNATSKEHPEAKQAIEEKKETKEMKQEQEAEPKEEGSRRNTTTNVTTSRSHVITTTDDNKAPPPPLLPPPTSWETTATTFSPPPLSPPSPTIVTTATTNKINRNNINQVGATVLFFRVNGVKEHVTYHAFHSGNFSHHYLDVECVAALERSQQQPNGGGEKNTCNVLPHYFIGSVIMSVQGVASSTQNPYHLPEGTIYTSITAVAQSREEKCDSSNPSTPSSSSGSKFDREAREDCLSYLSFQEGDIVLGLPALQRDQHDSVKCVAFNEMKNGVVYIFSDESIAAFHRKHGTPADGGGGDALNARVGRIVMMENVGWHANDTLRRVCKLTVSPL